MRLDISATQKASVISNPRWPFMRAMRPVAEWRSFLSNEQGATPDPRAVAPIVPRRYLRSQAACLPTPLRAHGAQSERGSAPDVGLFYSTIEEPHQTGEPRGLSPSGGKTPAKPHVSLHPCAPRARSPGSGVLPLKL